MKSKLTFLVITAIFSSFLLLGASATRASAQEEEADAQNPVAAYLAGLTGYTYEELVTLQKDGNGLGNIGRAYLFSLATGISLEEALTQAKEMGWGNLYKEYGLKPGGNGLGSLITKGPGLDQQPGPPPWAGGPSDKGGGPPEDSGGE